MKLEQIERVEPENRVRERPHVRLFLGPSIGVPFWYGCDWLKSQQSRERTLTVQQWAGSAHLLFSDWFAPVGLTALG